MAVIGVIDIMMKASVEPFLKGVSTAGSSLTKFLGKAAASVGLDTFGSNLAKIGPFAKSAASDLGGIAAQIGKMGVVAGGVGIAALIGLTTSSLHTIDATGDLAEKLGVTGGALSAFQHAVKLTGGPVEALPEILGKLNSTLGTAATEATPAAAAIRRLGLDAKALAAAGPIEATKSIAEGLSKIENPAMRAATATQIFGEQGAKLAGTFKAGSAGIAALEAEAVQLGISLKDTDYAKVAATNDALDRAGAAIAGVGSQLAVQLAPFIESAASKFTELATAGGGVGPFVAKGLDIALTGIGFVADGANMLKIAFLGTQTVITTAIGHTVKAIGSLGKGLESLINLIPGVEVSFTGSLDAIGDSLTDLAHEQGKSFREALAAPPPSSALKSFFSDIQSSADKSAAAIVGTGTAVKGLGDTLAHTAFEVGELETKLKEQIATVGMSASQIEVYKLAQKGAAGADLNRIAGLSNQLKALEASHKESEKFAADATKLFEDTRTPMEKFELEGSKIKAMFANGLIDQATMTRGLDKLKKETGIGDTEKRAGALELGSKEARSSILAFQQGGQQNAADEAAKKTAANTANNARVTSDLLVFFRQQAARAANSVVDLVGLT